MNAVKFAGEARLCEDKEDYWTKMNERAARMGERGTIGEGQTNGGSCENSPSEPLM